jgi:hypothetical protein
MALFHLRCRRPAGRFASAVARAGLTAPVPSSPQLRWPPFHVKRRGVGRRPDRWCWRRGPGDGCGRVGPQAVPDGRVCPLAGGGRADEEPGAAHPSLATPPWRIEQEWCGVSRETSPAGRIGPPAESGWERRASGRPPGATLARRRWALLGPGNRRVTHLRTRGVGEAPPGRLSPADDGHSSGRATGG